MFSGGDITVNKNIWGPGTLSLSAANITINADLGVAPESSSLTPKAYIMEAMDANISLSDISSHLTASSGSASKNAYLGEKLLQPGDWLLLLVRSLQSTIIISFMLEMENL